MSIVPDSVIGRKVFFIGLDINMLPDSYLENYLAHGYETYRITADHICSMQQKILLIANLYKGALLFFYIDSAIENTSWSEFIKETQNKFKDDIFIGVLYSKRGIESDGKQIETYYAQLGIQCGCTALSYQRHQNFILLDKVLAAYKANGRRKTVRALCNATSDATFDFGFERQKAALQDISLNHFSCIFANPEAPVALKDKFSNIQLLVNGSRYHGSATLVMQRDTPKGRLDVFMFMRSDDTPGLSDEDFSKLCPKIYQMVTEPTLQQLREGYFTINKQKNDVLSDDAVIARVVQELKNRT